MCHGNRDERARPSVPRCANGERACAGSVRQMNWAFWLLIPVCVTMVAALGSWWLARPKRVPSTQDAMRAHDEFLDALVQAARSKDRGLPSD